MPEPDLMYDVNKADLPEGSFWEETVCNLCGSEDYRVRYTGTTDQDMKKLLRSYSATGNFVSKETLVQCNQCQLIFTNPRLRRDLILKSYTDEEDPLYISQADGRIKSFKACLKKIMRHKERGRVLDIGAAAGFFLKVAKDTGWETYGIEPSKFLSDYGNKEYNVNIHNGTIEDAPFYVQQMDVITLWDVLEHTFDPKHVLMKCNQFLAKDGLVVINYPNIGNWMARLAGRHYWFILSVHLYYFVPKTIREMLSQTGFEIIEQGPHFQKLQLGYLLHRLQAYLPDLARFAAWIVKKLRMDKVLIPYYAAQTRVIARKVKDL